MARRAIIFMVLLLASFVTVRPSSTASTRESQTSEPGVRISLLKLPLTLSEGDWIKTDPLTAAILDPNTGLKGLGDKTVWEGCVRRHLNVPGYCTNYGLINSHAQMCQDGKKSGDVDQACSCDPRVLGTHCAIYLCWQEGQVCSLIQIAAEQLC